MFEYPDLGLVVEFTPLKYTMFRTLSIATDVAVICSLQFRFLRGEWTHPEPVSTVNSKEKVRCFCNYIFLVILFVI